MISLIDTNVLLAAAVPAGKQHRPAFASLQRLSGGLGKISPQIVREFHSVATRASRREDERPGFGFTPEESWALLDAFQTAFEVVDEDAAVVAELGRLSLRYAVSGRQIHDANLVATARRHGIPRIVTLNFGDFRRFSREIDVVTPDRA